MNIVYSSETPTEEGTEEKKSQYKDYQNSTYQIVSKVAYLIGVPRRIFENEYEPPQMEWFEKLEQNKNARMVRDLCTIRTAIERNYLTIGRELYYNLKNLNTLPDLIPPEAIKRLAQDGVSLIRANYKLNAYLVDINRMISDKINNCKDLFPIWLKWAYIRELFIMPNGLTEAGIKTAGHQFSIKRAQFPYQVYLNWPPSESGNILYNDKKFVSLLYELHEDYFEDISKVTDAGDYTKNGIYQFLADSRKTALVVDCENSDPFKLCAVLRNLEHDELSKICKIILYNDIHTTTAWRILDRYTDIPIEHEMIERIKENKSLVDIRLTAGTCKEFYQNNVDSFVIVSSDSDYWGLISSLQEAHFLVMVEYEKCGVDIKNALQSSGIFYCYIDDFCTGNSDDIKIAALLGEIRSTLEDALRLNVNDMLENAFTATRVDMKESEKKQFYNRYIKPLHLSIAADGTASLQLG